MLLSIFERLTGTRSVRIGGHLLLWDGKFTIGPQPHFVLLLILAVVLVNVLVLELVVSGSIVLTLLFLVIAKAEMLLLVSTAVTEPGIIPPSAPTGGEKPASSAIINGVTIERKWCFTCNHHMPPRGKHCGICHCCVDRHDHHCKFLSNCIGIRNYRSFVLLLSNSLVLALFVVVVMLVRGFNGAKAWALFVFATVASLLLANLVIYHFRLILKGATSYEQFKGFRIEDDEPHVSHVSPFSLGGWQVNLNAFLTMPTEPSRVRVRDMPHQNEEMVSVLGHASASP